MTVIRDPNSGNGQHVDEDNRAHVNAVTQGQDEDGLHHGKAYTINTGSITLTDAVDTPVLYIKNNEVDDLIISVGSVGLSASTGGTGNQQPIVTVVRGPRGGTIVDNATAVDIKANRNFGSALTGDNIIAYKGVTGNTMLNGADMAIFWMDAGTVLNANVNILIPPGSSIGVNLKASGSNTSMNAYVSVICHLDTDHSA
tara:strand:- start:15602 stop:16198 length:597 start_codon:yes stop_codon:yes gene_type:complete